MWSCSPLSWHPDPWPKFLRAGCEGWAGDSLLQCGDWSELNGAVVVLNPALVVAWFVMEEEKGQEVQCKGNIPNACSAWLSNLVSLCSSCGNFGKFRNALFLLLHLQEVIEEMSLCLQKLWNSVWGMLLVTVLRGSAGNRGERFSRVAWKLHVGVRHFIHNKINSLFCRSCLVKI